jgi:hypothetical protein
MSNQKTRKVGGSGCGPKNSQKNRRRKKSVGTTKVPTISYGPLEELKKKQGREGGEG